MFVLERSVESRGLTFFFDDNVKGFERELIGVLKSLIYHAAVPLSIDTSQYSSDVEVALGSTDHGWGKTVISSKTFVFLSEKIKWTTDDGCDFAELASTGRVPIKQVFLHEVMHVLGFEHDEDEESIMFHEFKCQNFGPEDTRRLLDKFGRTRVAVFTNEFFFTKTFQKVFLEINSHLKLHVVGTE